MAVYPENPRPILGSYNVNRQWRVLSTKTEVGQDLRRKKWTQPRKSWEMRYRPCGPDEISNIVKFWEARCGQFEEFEFVDFLAELHCELALGTGDGTEDIFPLGAKDETGLEIRIDGAITTAYSIEPAQMITIPVNSTLDGGNDWTALNGASSANVTDQRFEGTGSIKVDTPGGGINEGLILSASPGIEPAIPAEEYTISMYVRGASGTVRVSHRFFDAGESLISSSNGPTVTLDGTWQRLTHTATSPALTAFLGMAVTTDVAQVLTFWLDAPQMERGSVVSEWYAGGESPTVVVFDAPPAVGEVITATYTGRRIYPARFRGQGLSFNVDGQSRLQTARITIEEIKGVV